MAEAESKSIASRLARWRVLVQAAFLLVWLDPLALRMHNVCGVVFHCYSCPLATFACPVGVLANFSALHLVPFLAIGTLVICGAAVGAFVCGWACPFGLLQDLIGRVPVPKAALPNWTSYSRYAVLVGLVLVVPYLYSESHPLFICRLCPAGALEGAVPNMARTWIAGEQVTWPSALKLGILTLVLVAAFVKWRPWCSLLCPLGAIFGLFNRGSLLVLRMRVDRCRGCGQCHRMCRYGVLPDKNLNNARCIRCLECTRCSAITIGNAFQKADGQGPTS